MTPPPKTGAAGPTMFVAVDSCAEREAIDAAASAPREDAT